MTRDDVLAAALADHRAGRADSAEPLYLQLIAADADDPDAHHYLGILLKQAGRVGPAVDHLQRAAGLRPHDVKIRQNLGATLHDCGRFAEAEAAFDAVLALDPGRPEAHAGLGVAIAAQGRPADAIPHLRRAAELAPADAVAFCNLGIACRAAGRSDDAIATFHKAIDLAPGMAMAYGNLGTILFECNRLEEAVAAWRRALDLDTDHPDVHADLGIALGLLGRAAESIQSFRRAIALDGGNPVFHYNLGLALHGQGELDDAVGRYADALRIKPDYLEALTKLGNALYRISLVDAGKARSLALDLVEALPGSDLLRRSVGGIAGMEFPAEAERLYTTTLFDQFAKSFDATLGGLGYDMPEKLARAAGAGDGSGPADLDILDAGCGTGLCGLPLRPRARRLVGVDLSANMLEQARAKGLYDALVQDDVVAFMEDNAAGFDLVLAADVLVYIGDIAALARAMFRALRPGGICAVSAEALAEGDGRPFALSPSGRYRHTAPYLRQAFAAAGFAVDPLQTTSGRLEYGVPVPSWIVVGRT